jgi:hypothetical protein
MIKKNIHKSKFVSQLVRFTNVHVYKPISLIEGVQPKYGLTLLIPKTDKKEVKRFNEVFQCVKNENLVFFKGCKKILGGLRDGDTEIDSPEFSGHYFLNVSSSETPGVIDEDLCPIFNPDEVYNGCYGRASLTFYPFSAMGSYGIAAHLHNLQKLKDGERFSDVLIHDELNPEQ